MNEKGFKVVDRRGKEPNREPCRVCGAPGNLEPHTKSYNEPTMDCIKYLREEITRLTLQVKK